MHRDGTSSLSISRLLPGAALAAAVVLAVGGFAVARQLGNDQEHRLLAERADEVGALLSVSIEQIRTSLQVLGALGASSDPAGARLFSESAAPMVGRRTRAIVVARQRSGGLEVIASVGDGPSVGDVLSGDRARLVARAAAGDQLVSQLFAEGDASRLALAIGVRDVVAIHESVVDPRAPAPFTPDAPFRELRVALYAAPEIDPSKLVVTTELDVPLSGRVERVPFHVGADQWLLAVAARHPLVGTFARNVPWLVLAGGLAWSLLAATVVRVLGRRRAYALALVADRTAELEVTHDELRETRSFLERLLTAGPVLVRRVTVPDRTISYVSPNIERLFGTTQLQALAPGFLGSLVHPDDRAVFHAGLDNVAEGGSAFESIEYRVCQGNGPPRWVSATLVPEIDDAGRIVAVLSYVVDADDRRKAEQAQRDAQQEAERANHAKTEFLSRMSHELRTPLNAVLGFGQLLEMDTLTDDQRDAVSHILKGGRHLLDLINEVLDIARVESGNLALSPEAVLASEIIHETVDLIRPLARQRGIQLVANASSVECFLFADRQRTKQVLLNLLSNAVKYNRPGGTVAVSSEQSTDSCVRMAVTDTGPGIPAERLGLLFTPFERLDADQTGEEGTGIGLALSRRLAEAMGGSLDVVSTLERGSTFTVELPRVEGPVDRYERLRPTSTTNSTPVSTPRCTVLHIEDNLANLKLVERILAQRTSVEVVGTMQGSLGLELAIQHRPDLVLLDLHLPDMGGEQVLQRLRDHPVTASIPVAIVSADATPGQVQRLLSAGAAGYLTKPLDVPELLRLLDQVLTAS